MSTSPDSRLELDFRSEPDSWSELATEIIRPLCKQVDLCCTVVLQFKGTISSRSEFRLSAGNGTGVLV